MRSLKISFSQIFKDFHNDYFYSQFCDVTQVSKGPLSYTTHIIFIIRNRHQNSLVFIKKQMFRHLVHLSWQNETDTSISITKWYSCSKWLRILFWCRAVFCSVSTIISEEMNSFKSLIWNTESVSEKIFNMCLEIRVFQRYFFILMSWKIIRQFHKNLYFF